MSVPSIGSKNGSSAFQPVRTRPSDNELIKLVNQDFTNKIVPVT